MRRVYKARIVPDHAPDGLTEKMIRVSDLGVPISAALGEWDALTDLELDTLHEKLSDLMIERMEAKAQ